MVNKTKKTFKEWVASSKEQLEALQQQPKGEQNEKIIYKDVQSLATHLCSKDIKNSKKMLKRHKKIPKITYFYTGLHDYCNYCI